MNSVVKGNPSLEKFSSSSEVLSLFPISSGAFCDKYSVLCRYVGKKILDGVLCCWDRQSFIMKNKARYKNGFLISFSIIFILNQYSHMREVIRNVMTQPYRRRLSSLASTHQLDARVPLLALEHIVCMFYSLQQPRSSKPENA